LSESLNGKADNSRGKWLKLALMTAAVSAWLIYDMATATESPSQLLLILQYFLLACALFSLVGSLIKLASPQ
jgi:multisubunit Na+/H+ antiporter MnhE subunit